MEKGKGKPDDSLGNIYITYDVEMAQKDPFYLERWVFLKKESSRVSRFVRKLHKHFGIHKNVFEMTLNMNNSTVNKYFDIPDKSLPLERCHRPHGRMHHPVGASAQQEQRIYRKLQESRNKLQRGDSLDE